MNREEDMAGYAKQGTATPLAPVNEIKILVTITDVAADGMAVFTLEGEFPPDHPYVDNGTKTIKVPRGSPDVKLIYKLRDRTNPSKDLDFCRSSPIWVTGDMNSCPTTACSEAEIELDSVKKKQLEVIDHNSGPGQFRFSLVLDSDSGRVLADPIIRNEP